MNIKGITGLTIHTQDGKKIGTVDGFKTKEFHASDDYKSTYAEFSKPKEISFKLNNCQWNQYMMYQMMGYQFIESLAMIDKIQIRKHKSKRINKKWAKRYGFREVPKKDIFLVGRSFVAHPTVMALVKRELNKMR